MKNANLSKIELTAADLSDTDFAGKNMHDSTLTGANSATPCRPTAPTAKMIASAQKRSLSTKKQSIDESITKRLAGCPMLVAI
jgi:hypothetical protein